MQSSVDEIAKSRRIAGTLVGGLGSLILVGSSASKFAHVPRVVAELAAVGFSGNLLVLIAILELGSVLLFLVPLSRAFGLQMISAYLGGAIATHIQHGQSPIPPAFVLALLWTGAWLRHPILLWSFQTPISNRESPAVRQKSVFNSISHAGN